MIDDEHVYLNLQLFAKQQNFVLNETEGIIMQMTNLILQKWWFMSLIR